MSENQTPLNASPEFTPPKHWIGIEELEASYWADAANREKRGQEFFEKPVEWLEKMDRSAEGGIARRDFLTVMGASMALMASACARRPVHKIIPYVVKPEEITPGVANYYASTSPAYYGAHGLLIKTREGRPIKLEGNPEHPLNVGRLSAREQGSLLSLYDPERLGKPVLRDRATGGRKESSWDEVDAVVGAKLKSAARVRVLTRPNPSDSSRRLISEFKGLFKDGKVAEFQPVGYEEIAEAQQLSYGSSVVPSIRFEAADVVVSLGADFLGTWVSPVEYAAAWAKRRKLEANKRELSKVFVFESMMSVTGANADERYPVRPGDELSIALAIAHELIVKRGLTSYAGNAQVRTLLQAYSADAVAANIGLVGGAAAITAAADALLKARGRSVVVAGGISARTDRALALQVAVNFLNSALDNEGVTVDGSARAIDARGSASELESVLSDIRKGGVDVLVLHRVNLGYWLSSAAFAPALEALSKVPFVVLVSDREDETARFADVVLPESHFLESWGDSHSRRGLVSLRQPAISPLFDTRSFEDMILSWMRASGLRPSAPATWHDYLKAAWRSSVYPSARAVAGFDAFWEGALRLGFVNLEAASGSSGTPSRRSFQVAALSKIPAQPMKVESGLTLALYEKVILGDGSEANNAWLQEIPDPVTTITWDNYLNVSPALAKSMNLKRDDVVEVVSGDVRVELPVNVQPGLHPSVVAAAIGYGRTAAGKVGTGAGVNVFPFVKTQGADWIYSGHSVSIKKTGRFYRLAATQWHSATEDRPVINDVTLAEYQANPKAESHTNPHLRMDVVPTMWKQHEYKGHRWGMAIDLNSCIGCNACVVACQAENNIPVVGRDQVRVSRQMHWIRIDRYYSGSAERPDVIFQPMLCQHCENAPCETVCPVLATVHNDEGLNIQAYNRCVGTRYCSNNCPYKARRFNFFDHWKAYEGTLNNVWNPDVTVRTRGIMEKCTFCTHRITAAKDQAKDRGERLKDGDLLTACQQTCPTDAIVFGDINDPESRVSRLKKEPRVFRSLEVLNTRPAVDYMTKVRNKPADHSAHPSKGAHA